MQSRASGWTAPKTCSTATPCRGGLLIVGPSGAEFAPAPAALNSRDPAEFLRVINNAMGRDPPAATDATVLASWHGPSLRPGAGDVWTSLTDGVCQVWQTQMDEAHEQVRVSVAMGDLAALEPAEAIYFVRFHDDTQEALHGQHRYRLHIPASDIPTDPFWSFTAYEPTADGKHYVVANPTGRDAIGNHTRGLRRNADGSLDAALHRAAPSR